MDSEPADTTKKNQEDSVCWIKEMIHDSGTTPWVGISVILKLSLTKNENYSSEVCSRTSHYLDIVKGEQVYENN